MVLPTASGALVFKAGRAAFDVVRRHGFDPARIGTIAGASGGPKWLVLSQLDRVILKTILPKLREPVHLLGSSIGAWRFACYGQADARAAIERLESAYLEQSYSADPDMLEISAKSREILRHVLGDTGVAEILSHPVFRSHILTVRARHLMASERPLLLGAGLIAAGALNAISRASLGMFFERALFYDSRGRPPFFAARGFPMQRVQLSELNLEQAITATGSIPLVLSGVRDIAGAARGVYRDGGIIDYHLDLPLSEPERLTLYPHFYDYVVPGWFDKRLVWRRARPEHLDRTILVSPSPEFVSRLPNRKLPERSDFRSLSHAERVRAWRHVVAACAELADELHEVIVQDRLAARLERL